ncbi:MAG: 3-keto-5-aminohexanoate cleavage protein, partial [Deltaproteobacteria bacterium]|nr:3-keto-5-aminohexanoate cleavage protein [Deltaproteobacteria bacterium]
GGHARVGMEDNLYLGKGRPAENNGEMVEKMVRIIRELDREPISPDKTRQVLGLKGKGGTAFS